MPTARLRCILGRTGRILMPHMQGLNNSKQVDGCRRQLEVCSVVQDMPHLCSWMSVAQLWVHLESVIVLAEGSRALLSTVLVMAASLTLAVR